MADAIDRDIQAFLAGGPFAVVGASDNREKYGNKVLRCYLQNGREAHAVNPARATVEGRPCYPDLASVPGKVHGVSLITPPAVTEKVVGEAARLGIRNLWMQPGAESEAAVANARAHGMNVIAGGPCLLVVLGFREV